MRSAPEPDKDGNRWYGPAYAKVAEDPKCCIASVSGGGRGFSSHQCRAPRKDGTEYCGVHMPAPDERITMFYVGCGNWDAKEVGGIKTVEVARLTDSKVQLPNNRWDLLVSKSGRYFMDKETAVQFVRDGLVSRIDSYQRSLAYAKEELTKFNAIYPETPT